MATRSSGDFAQQSGGTHGESLERLVADLHRTVVRVVHEVNNPLAVISGNAQFLIELARDGTLDGDLAKSCSDMEEASARLSASMQLLSDLGVEIESILESYHQTEREPG